MTIAILGHGNVGGALARAFRAKGVDVVIAADPSRSEALPDWILGTGCQIALPELACAQCDALLLAIPFGAVDEALVPLRGALHGKPIIDCTNPVSQDLSHGLKSERSGSEYVQAIVPESPVAKCFSIYGFENFEKPQTGAIRPAMLIAGDSTAATEIASRLASIMGWDPVIVGPLALALHLEHMTLMWIKMVRVHGASAHTLWAKLEESKTSLSDQQ